MQPVSDRFDAALRGTPEPVLRAELWRWGQRVALPSGDSSLKVTGGMLTVDETSKTRRTAMLTIADRLTTDQAADLLCPADTDLRLWGGVRHSEGDEELVPLGVFRVDETSFSSWLGALQLRCIDYSGMLAASRFESPWITAAGASVVTEARAMVADALSVDWYDLTGSRATTAEATWEDERWDAIESLAASIAADPFFDANGRFALRPVAHVTPGASVWTIDSYTPRAVMIDASMTWSARMYNAVVATSASAEEPVYATAYQLAGRYAYRHGFKRPRRYSSPALLTVEQCQRAAAAILARSLAASVQVSLVCAPNPALDVGDQVTVVLPDGTTEDRIVSRISLPLGLGPMTVDTRTSPDDGSEL